MTVVEAIYIGVLAVAVIFSNYHSRRRVELSNASMEVSNEEMLDELRANTALLQEHIRAQRTFGGFSGRVSRGGDA